MNLIDPTLIYLKASFATTAKTYQSLPSEFIFFSSFTMVKPGFCAKISSQISDPQKTTVQRKDNYELLLSVPVVNPKKQFSMYRLINLPAIENGIPTIPQCSSMHR